MSNRDEDKTLQHLPPDSYRTVEIRDKTESIGFIVEIRTKPAFYELFKESFIQKDVCSGVCHQHTLLENKSKGCPETKSIAVFISVPHFRCTLLLVLLACFFLFFV